MASRIAPVVDHASERGASACHPVHGVGPYPSLMNRFMLSNNRMKCSL